MIRRLYHYTSIVHWVNIDRVGLITPTESNISMTETHAGPDVVWLASDHRRLQSWQAGSAVDKSQVRITVEIEHTDVHWWPRWSRRHGIDPSWYHNLDAAGGYASTEWYVVERAIPREEWVNVETET